MPFSLKNVGVTYYRLMNKMFAQLIGKSMKVYVDDMLVKSKRVSEHIRNLKDCFDVFRQYQMKLNSPKCAFRVESAKFLGFMVNQWGIKAKAQAVIDLQPPRTIKEIQRLTGIIAALSRFMSKSIDKCHHFFQALKGIGKINLDDKCEVTFQGLKMYLASLPLLSREQDTNIRILQ